MQHVNSKTLKLAPIRLAPCAYEIVESDNFDSRMVLDEVTSQCAPHKAADARYEHLHWPFESDVFPTMLLPYNFGGPRVSRVNAHLRDITLAPRTHFETFAPA